ADGPIIQRSSERALARGVTLARVLEAVRRIRKTSDLPLLLFSYFNPLLRFGLPALAREAQGAGVDGVLVTDLPPEEADGWQVAAAASVADAVVVGSALVRFLEEHPDGDVAGQVRWLRSAI